MKLGLSLTGIMEKESDSSDLSGHMWGRNPDYF